MTSPSPVTPEQLHRDAILGVRLSRLTKHQKAILQQMKKPGAYIDLWTSDGGYPSMARLEGTHIYGGSMKLTTFLKLRDVGCVMQSGERTATGRERWVLNV